MSSQVGWMQTTSHTKREATYFTFSPIAWPGLACLGWMLGGSVSHLRTSMRCACKVKSAWAKIRRKREVLLGRFKSVCVLCRDGGAGGGEQVHVVCNAPSLAGWVDCGARERWEDQ